ncbi:MAG: hypothetical protein AAGK78_15050, partial [Planctomycetota bacterium]
MIARNAEYARAGHRARRQPGGDGLVDFARFGQDQAVGAHDRAERDGVFTDNPDTGRAATDAFTPRLTETFDDGDLVGWGSPGS